MFADLLKLLTGTEEPERLDPQDQKLALATLMVRVARADEHYDPVEKDMIDAILRERFGLSDPAAVRAEAEALEAEASDTVRFTKIIKNTVPYEDREAVVEALWKIVLADGERAAEENALLRQVVSLIGVNDRDSNFARQRAQRA